MEESRRQAAKLLWDCFGWRGAQQITAAGTQLPLRSNNINSPKLYMIGPLNNHVINMQISDRWKDCCKSAPYLKLHNA